MHYVILLMHKGMLGIAMKHTMNRYFMLNDIGLKAKWKMFQSDEAMMKDIRHLIRKNKPVILAIGQNRYNPFGNKGIRFYVEKDGAMKESHRGSSFPLCYCHRCRDSKRQRIFSCIFVGKEVLYRL